MDPLIAPPPPEGGGGGPPDSFGSRRRRKNLEKCLMFPIIDPYFWVPRDSNPSSVEPSSLIGMLAGLPLTPRCLQRGPI